MAVHQIAVIGGDGIGVDVIDQAVRVVQAAAKAHDPGEKLELNPLPWGSDFYRKNGRILPTDG